MNNAWLLYRLSVTGQNPLGFIVEKFRDHQNSQSHRFAMQQLLQASKPAEHKLSSQINKPAAR